VVAAAGPLLAVDLTERRRACTIMAILVPATRRPALTLLRGEGA
jgi:hypothetical protein